MSKFESFFAIISGDIHEPPLAESPLPGAQGPVGFTALWLPYHIDRFMYWVHIYHIILPSNKQRNLYGIGKNVDHYKALEVDRKASIEVIEKAYKALVKKYHPDKLSDVKKDWANKKMIKLNEAYRVLKDPVLRVEYDQSRANIYDIFLNEGLIGIAKNLKKII